MKKLILIIVFILFGFNIVLSQVFYEERPSPVTTSLNSVSAYSSWVYICGDSSKIIVSTNSGYDFYVSNPGIPTGIKFVNIDAFKNFALTTGYKDSTTYVYRTANGGQSWQLVFTQINCKINTVFLYDSMNVFMNGNPKSGRWIFMKSTDGGLNWDSTGLYLPEPNSYIAGYPNSAAFINNNIWFGTNINRIYFSTNKGINWTAQSIGSDSGITAINFINATTGVSGGLKFFKTTNSGVLWSKDTNAKITTTIKGIHNTLTNYPLYYASGNKIVTVPYPWVYSIYYTAPNGNYNHFSGNKFNMITGPGVDYGVRSNGGITRGNYVIDAVRVISTTIGDNYNLYQNYPNPFNSQTKFRFDTKKLPEINIGDIRGANIRLTIYNSIGQEVEVIINKVIQPGTYEAEWNASNYPSGIYFYRITASNPLNNSVVYDQTKKMIMIK